MDGQNLGAKLTGTRQSKRRRIATTFGPDYVEGLHSISVKSLQMPGLKEEKEEEKTGRKRRKTTVTVTNAELPVDELVSVNSKELEQNSVCNECKVGSETDWKIIRCIGLGCQFCLANLNMIMKSESVEAILSGDHEAEKCDNCRDCFLCDKGSILSNTELIGCSSCEERYHVRTDTEIGNLIPIGDQQQQHDGGYGDNLKFLDCFLCPNCQVVPVDQTVTSGAIETEDLKKTADGANSTKEEDHEKFVPDLIIASSPVVMDPIKKRGKPKKTLVFEEEERHAEPSSVACQSKFGTLMSNGNKSRQMPCELRHSVNAEISSSSIAESSVADVILTKNHVDVVHCNVPEMINARGNKPRNDKELSNEELAMFSVEQCAELFACSYPDLAALIGKHRMFGSSLLLVTRLHFLDYFGLPVGTALKMHHAVCKLRRSYF